MPDQLHGNMLFGVSALAGLVIGVLLALLLAWSAQPSSTVVGERDAGRARGHVRAGRTGQPNGSARPTKPAATPAEDDVPQMVTWD